MFGENSSIACTLVVAPAIMFNANDVYVDDIYRYVDIISIYRYDSWNHCRDSNTGFDKNLNRNPIL